MTTSERAEKSVVKRLKLEEERSDLLRASFKDDGNSEAAIAIAAEHEVWLVALRAATEFVERDAIEISDDAFREMERRLK